MTPKFILESPRPVVEAESLVGSVFSIGDKVRFDSGERLGRSGVVTSSELRECPIDRKQAWYYRVRWQGARTDQGLYHKTLLCAETAKAVAPPGEENFTE